MPELTTSTGDTQADAADLEGAAMPSSGSWVELRQVGGAGVPVPTYTKAGSDAFLYLGVPIAASILLIAAGIAWRKISQEL